VLCFCVEKSAFCGLEDHCGTMASSKELQNSLKKLDTMIKETQVIRKKWNQLEKTIKLKKGMWWILCWCVRVCTRESVYLWRCGLAASCGACGKCSLCSPLLAHEDTVLMDMKEFAQLLHQYKSTWVLLEKAGG
jgi:hypothetical protein